MAKDCQVEKVGAGDGAEGIGLGYLLLTGEVQRSEISSNK